MFRLVGVAVFLGGKIFAGRNYVRHVQPSRRGVVGRVAVERSRLGAVTARAASAGGRGGFLDRARSRCTARPASPAAVTAARRWW